MIDLAVVVAALVVWFGVYAFCRVLTRPALPHPAPATMDLGPESPALVSLLVNRWHLTEDAAESTLLDLAARKFFELRQPGIDPMQTTVHLPATGPDASGLKPYENQVLERIRRLAVGGVVPITALTFRDAGESKTWNTRLRASVIAEARAAGLSRRRFGKAITTLLLVTAALAAVVIGLAAVHYGIGRRDDDKPGFGAGILAFFVLSAVAGRALGERDTPAGQEVAARWLGVRAWLRGHDQFADLPPAAVAVWDRYLAYGAAVGATRLSSAVLDLEMGNRKLVWSSFGGTWHRVRVHYPRLWPRYGQKTSRLVLQGLITSAIGTVVILEGGRRYADLTKVGAVILLFGVYFLARTLADLAITREITGEVLWRETWKSRGGGEDNPPVPWLEYLAVDDGSSDRTTAWGMPVDLSCRDGDTVTIGVRRWSRRVVTLRVDGQGRTREVTSSLTDEETGNMVLQMAPAPAPSVVSADDVAQMFGRPVTAEPMPAGIQYKASDNGKTLLLVQAVGGLPGRIAWKANSRGVAQPSGAFVNGDRAAFRTGELTVVLTLLGDGKVARSALPWLVERALQHDLRSG